MIKPIMIWNLFKCRLAQLGLNPYFQRGTDREELASLREFELKFYKVFLNEKNSMNIIMGFLVRMCMDSIDEK